MDEYHQAGSEATGYMYPQSSPLCQTHTTNLNLGNPLCLSQHTHTLSAADSLLSRLTFTMHTTHTTLTHHHTLLTPQALYPSTLTHSLLTHKHTYTPILPFRAVLQRSQLNPSHAHT